MTRTTEQIDQQNQWAAEARVAELEADRLEDLSNRAARREIAVLANGLTNASWPEQQRLRSQVAGLERAAGAARTKAEKLYLASQNGWPMEQCDAHRCSMEQRKKGHAHRG